MTRIVRTERRKRGIFGTIAWWMFLAYNGLMALWLYHGISGAVEMSGTAANDAGRAGAAIGGTIAAGVIIGVWMAGSIILGLIVLLSRGKTVIEERVVD